MEASAAQPLQDSCPCKVKDMSSKAALSSSTSLRVRAVLPGLGWPRWPNVVSNFLAALEDKLTNNTVNATQPRIFGSLVFGPSSLPLLSKAWSTRGNSNQGSCFLPDLTEQILHLHRSSPARKKKHPFSVVTNHARTKPYEAVSAGLLSGTGIGAARLTTAGAA